MYKFAQLSNKMSYVILAQLSMCLSASITQQFAVIVNLEMLA